MLFPHKIVCTLAVFNIGFHGIVVIQKEKQLFKYFLKFSHGTPKDICDTPVEKCCSMARHVFAQGH